MLHILKVLAVDRSQSVGFILVDFSIVCRALDWRTVQRKSLGFGLLVAVVKGIIVLFLLSVRHSGALGNRLKQKKKGILPAETGPCHMENGDKRMQPKLQPSIARRSTFLQGSVMRIYVYILYEGKQELG